MNRMRAYENAQNLISHSGSPINLRDGLRALADAYVKLLAELHTAERQLEDARYRDNFQP